MLRTLIQVLNVDGSDRGGPTLDFGPLPLQALPVKKMVYVFLRATTPLISKEEMIKYVCLIAIQDSFLYTYCYKN